MGDTQILTPGEKIKYIRKEFKIKQNEITGGKITRNLISLIENNKAELTASTASIISECVNKICKQKNIDFTMTPQDLLINNTMQADKILDDLINEIIINKDNNDNFDFSNLISKSETLIKQNPSLNKIVDLYSNLGEAFLNRNNYWKAYIFFFKAYEHIDFQIQKVLLPDVVVKLSYTCNKLLKFSESIQIINTVLSLNIELSDLIQYKLILNKAIAHKNLSNYMAAIKTLQEINKNNLDDTHLFNIKTLESNCYKELQLYKDALDVQFDLLDKNYSDDDSKKIIILCNIIDIYLNINNEKSVKHYLNKAMNLIKSPSLKISKYYIISIYYSLAIANIYVKNYDDAIILLNQSLNESKNYNYYKSEFNSINKLFSIYSERNDFDKLEELKVYLMELLMNDNRPEYHTLIYKYINIYSMQNKKDDLDSLVSFALSLDSRQEEKNSI